MSYKLRFVQKFQQNKENEFMELERAFMKLEQEVKEFPKGKRFTPHTGRESLNTLIWECEFDTLEEAQAAMSFLEKDPRHEELFQKQVLYFIESYAEIYKSLA